MNLMMDHIGVERNHQFLFSDIHCKLSPGDLLHVRGPNGSGKSTLLRVLSGFKEPHQGNIRWNGKCIFREVENYQRLFHYISHQDGVKSFLTVFENLALANTLMKGNVEKNELLSILEKVGLKDVCHCLAKNLSAGQSRRLALARLLLKPVSLWILDEPMTSLDAQGQEWFHDLLQDHLKNKGIAILTSHHLLGISSPKTIHLGEHRV